MVREFDTKIKREKTYRFIVLAVAAVLVIGGALLAWRTVAYTTTKHKIEEKFAKGVEKYGFVSNESDFDPRYSLETPDGISYEIQYEEMDSFMRGREWWDLPGKYIVATFGPGKSISVESEDGSVSSVPYNLRLSYTEGALFINATRTDSGATIASGSIYFDEDGTRVNDMDFLMEQIVSDNSDTFEAVLTELRTMWSDIYQSPNAK